MLSEVQFVKSHDIIGEDDPFLIFIIKLEMDLATVNDLWKRLVILLYKFIFVVKMQSCYSLQRFKLFLHYFVVFLDFKGEVFFVLLVPDTEYASKTTLTQLLFDIESVGQSLTK